MKFERRKLLRLAAGAVAMPAVSRIARAQTYPHAKNIEGSAIFAPYLAAGAVLLTIERHVLKNL
jgi:hypothetical protein